MMPAGVYRLKALSNVAQAKSNSAPQTRLIEQQAEVENENEGGDGERGTNRCLKCWVMDESTGAEYCLFEYTPWSMQPSIGATLTLLRPISLVHGLAPVKATDLQIN